MGIEKVFKVCDEIEKAIGKLRDSSGCGFGTRNMQFEFETEARADAAEEIIKSILEKHNIDLRKDGYITVFDNDENEEA